MTLQLHAPNGLTGHMPAPPSKSMAHRMLICAALANGVSEVENIEYSVDIKTTITALEQLGAKITCRENNVQVTGVSQQFPAVTQAVNCAESGSTLRFMVPLFSLTGQKVRFTGAARLFQRPLTVYEDIFSALGLYFTATTEDLTIQGCLQPGEYNVPGNVSSQFISGLLFALPLLEKDSRIRISAPVESRSYIELTRNAQALFGVVSHWENENTLLIPGGQQYSATNARVEGDWSNGAVCAVLSAIAGNIKVSGLSAASPQGDAVVLNILQRCGATLVWNDGLLHVQTPANGLHAPIEAIDLADCPDLGPILCALALFCKGTTHFVNAGRLRIKESDRIAAMQAELQTIGGRISSTEDTITIEGGYPLLNNQTINSHNDHRIVMALSTAALGAGLQITIKDAGAITKSWPSYFADLQKIGVEVHHI